jgi:hypothetical protein
LAIAGTLSAGAVLAVLTAAVSLATEGRANSQAAAEREARPQINRPTADEATSGLAAREELKRAVDLQGAPGISGTVERRPTVQPQILAKAQPGGQVNAQIGWVEPKHVDVKLLAEPPKLTPELRAMVEKACDEELHRGRPLPVTGSPELAVPTTAPTAPASRLGQARAPGDMQYFVNSAVTPAGASTSVVAEPSVGNNGKLVFQSGNWYAAISTDHGSTWSHVDPATSFPSVNGGFCCDQIVIYEPSRDIMIWLLQYSRDADDNTHRFAIAKGVSDLENLAWCLYDFSPTDVGIPLGYWFDFPDLVVGNNSLYWTTNVFTTDTFCSGGQSDGNSCTTDADCGGFPCKLQYLTSLIARLPLTEMSECTGFGFGYWNQLGFDPDDRRSSWRVCHGTSSVAYWAAHNTTSSIRIFRWEEGAGSITWDDVAHDPFDWNDANMTCPGPDGNDSCARADTRILGAYNNTLGELGFMWISAPHGIYPYPYTRIARFQESDRALIANEAIWYNQGAWIYPSVGVNSRGHLAGTIFFAGENIHPQCDVWVSDDFSPSFPSIAPIESYLGVQGTDGPASDKWGDYLATRPHAPFDETWIGSCFSLQGGTGNGDIEPRHIWFGRERDAPPPPPGNDECNAAFNIFSTPYASDIDTRGATRAKLDPKPSCTATPNSNTVWYTYTPPCDGTVTAETCNSNYDTVLTVYTGSCGDLSQVACDDDSCGEFLQSRIANLPVVGGETYYIEVGDYNLPGGGFLRFRFGFTPDSVPANDRCVQARFVGVPSSTPGTTLCADQDDAPDCNVGVTSPGVWYRVRGTGRTMTASVCNAGTDPNYDSKISVYCGGCANLGGLQCVADNDDNCNTHSGLLSTVSWCSEYGASYLILVHGFGGSSGDFVLDVSDDGVLCTGAVDCGGDPLGGCCVHGAGNCSPGICGDFNACGEGCICGLTSDGDGACFGGFQLCDFLTPCPNGNSDCAVGELCWVGSCCDGPVCSLPCPQNGLKAADMDAVDLSLTPMGTTPPNAGERGLGTPCIDVTRSICAYAGGIYQGDGVPCDDSRCLGACCVEGTCTGVSTEYDCELSGGEWFYGQDCSTITCPAAQGACCPGYACLETLECNSPEPGRYSCGGTLGCICLETFDGGTTCANGFQECGEACLNGPSACPPGSACVLNSCCNDGLPTCIVEGCPGPVPPDRALEPGERGVLGDRTIQPQHRGGGTGANGCVETDELSCVVLGADYQGDGTVCLDTTCPAPGACCLEDGVCVIALADECVALGGEPRPPGTLCGPGVCTLFGACCIGGACVGNSDEISCLREGGQWFFGEDCRDFVCPTGQTQACCSPDNRECIDEVPDVCIEVGGTPQGPGTRCLGDQDENGFDDACETDEPCEDCGPGPHWVDECLGGIDSMPSGALIGIDFEGDCVQDQTLRLSGPVQVRRSDPLDDSNIFSGIAPVDGHREVIDTEIVSLSLSGGGVTMIAGGGLGTNPLRRSLGAIVEQRYLPAWADSFFDVFFEVDLGGGVLAYNQEPLRVVAKIDCLPPDTTYIHPIDCVKLYTTPIPGEGDVVAYLVTADHSTYPDCGDPSTGPCFEPHQSPFCDDDACCERVCEIEPRCCSESWAEACADLARDLCQTQACCRPQTGQCQDVPADLCEIELLGIPQGFGTRCEGDTDGDGVDQACQAEKSCEDCGRGDHWIDECDAGTDQMNTGALIGIDTTGDCQEDTTVRLTGPVNVVRSAPKDDSTQFPGLAPLDGHRDVLDTEILSMHLSGGGMSMVAGGGLGQAGVLRRSLGAIVEQPADPAFGDSFFDVYFEFDLGGGNYLYNHAPLRVSSKIDCVPPATTYIHPFDCIPLFNSPYPGTGEAVAQLVRADHSTDLDCGVAAAGDCFTPNNTPYCDDETCCRRVCEIQPLCCERMWSPECADMAREICVQACCFPEGRCANLPPDICAAEGGTPLGTGTLCEGDGDGDGADDICQADEPCEDCGPDPHWIDECDPGTDQMNGTGLMGLDLNNDCVEDVTVHLGGFLNVGRSAPLDDSNHYPGIAPVDGHREVIDTEILSMHLNGGGMSMVAGGGLGQGGILQRTLGVIIEQPFVPTLGTSFFDVFFQFDLGGGNYVYNRTPLRVWSKINCVPPDTVYIHPFDCIPLYRSPFPGTGDEIVARLVRANQSTHPECGDPTTGDCFEAHTSPYCDSEDCCRKVCDREPRCCEDFWGPGCADLAREICLEACCLPEGRCADLPPDLCEEEFDGVPKGPSSRCEGDANGNNVDDACEFDEPCEICGPGEHWVDECPGGLDNMPSAALVGIDVTLDCEQDSSFRLTGPVTVMRSNPRDDSFNYPGTRPIDGHRDVIDTEIVSMVLTRSGVTLVAGAGLGQGGVLPPSYGVIAEQPADITLADSFFDVFFEVDLGNNTYAYNHRALRVEAKIDCLPPDTTYIHPRDCIPLYDVPPLSPVKPRLVANLVTADHSTFPARIVRARPEHEGSLWRSDHNIVRVEFDDDITQPAAGQIMIRELAPGGLFGPDLSSRFTFTVENNGGGQPRVLRIWENVADTLDHRKWYSMANLGGWAGVSPFDLHYVVQVGDASADKRVLAFDVSVINTGIPTFAAPDDERRDINGDGRIVGFDVILTNTSVPSFPVPKPAGHP